ncbi:MAG: hypothetical protein ABSF84_17845, partial [Acidimicrobiales bacterium]
MRRAMYLERALKRWLADRRQLEEMPSSERGDTLVEVLFALVVLSIAGLALVTGFATSITASAEHRSLSSLDASTRVAANRAIADIQQQAQTYANQPANDPFVCGNTFTPSFSNLPGNFEVTYNAPNYWNSSPPSPGWQSGCIADAPQQYTLTISSTTVSYSTSVTTVITDPGAPQSPTGAGAAYQLVWLPGTEPTGGSAETPFSPQPEVAVEDKQGDIVSSDFSSVTLALMSAPTGGTISSTCSGVESYGIVQFSDCSVNLAGSYEIQAVDAGLFPTPGATFTVSANPAVKVSFTTTPVSATASKSATSGPITVQIQDTFGTAITASTSEAVALTSTSSAGVFSLTPGGTAVTSVTIPAGSSSASFYYGDSTAGTPTITATPPLASGLAAGTQTETITGAAASKLAITSSPFTAAAGNSAATPFTVTLEDTYGNATTSAGTTTVKLSSTSGTGKFAATSGGTGVTSVPLAAGTSTVTAYYGDTTTGTPTITAAATGLTSGTQKETVTGGPTKLVWSTAPVTGHASAGAAIGPITVTEEAANGTATTAALTINLSSSSSGTYIFNTTQGTTSPSGATSVSIPGGSSSVTFYYGDTLAGTPTITAASTGLPSITQQETVTAGTASQLAITSTAFSGAANSSATNAFTVTLEDGFGNATTSPTATTVNLVSNSAGTHEFAATSGGTPVTSVTLPANTASVTAYYGDETAGTPTITAATTGLTWGTQTETITAGTGTKLAITSTAFSGAANSSATNAFTVTLEDGFGNATTKTTATTINLSSNSTGTHEFSATSGGTATTSVTLPANTSSVSAYYGDETPGTPTITAAATGLTSGTQQESITAGAPAKVVFTTGSVSGPASSSATLGPITVELQDAYGNVATSGSPTTVNLTSTSAGASFSATSGGAAITSVTIPGSYSTASFFYGDTKAGSPTVSAGATGLTSGTQVETITALAGTQLGVSTFTGGAGASATNAFTVTLEDTYGNATTKAGATTVTLSTTSGTGKFAATSGGASVASVTLPANTASVTAYYGDTTAGSPTITAAATGLTSGSQAETITGGTGTKLVITSTAFSGGASISATNAFTVTLEDAYG